MNRFTRFISSWWIFFALLIPLLISGVLMIKGLHLPPSYIFRAKAFSLYYILITLFLVIKGILYIRSKRYLSSGVSFLSSMALLYIFYIYNSDFRAMAIASEGERIEEFYDLEKGIFAKMPGFPLVVKRIEDNKCLLLIDKKEVELKPGDSASFGRYRITLKGIKEGYIVQLKDRGKRLIDEAHIPLLETRRKGYLMFPVIPHRFYLSPVSKERVYWKEEGGEWKIEREEREIQVERTLHLIILRGKLTVIDKDIKEDEDIAFEGHYVNIRRGSPFVDLLIERRGLFYH